MGDNNGGKKLVLHATDPGSTPQHYILYGLMNTYQGSFLCTDPGIIPEFTGVTPTNQFLHEVRLRSFSIVYHNKETEALCIEVSYIMYRIGLSASRAPC